MGEGHPRVAGGGTSGVPYPLHTAQAAHQPCPMPHAPCPVHLYHSRTMDHEVALVQAYLQLVEAVTAEDDRRPHERHPRGGAAPSTPQMTSNGALLPRFEE